MVSKVNARGLHDWMVQRITAFLLLIFFGLMLFFLFERGHAEFSSWQGLFHLRWVKVLTLLAMSAVSWHAWVGLWTIFTDYVKNAALRRLLEVLACALIVVYLIWTIVILW